MIKEISRNRRGSTLSCTNCGHSETVGLNGNKYKDYSTFTNDCKYDYYEYGSIIECTKCGEKDTYGKFSLAKLPNSECVHLGVAYENNYFFSRCGRLTGTESDRRLVFVSHHVLKNINLTDIKHCKGCEINEGNTVKDRALATKNDLDIINSFFEFCEENRRVSQCD